MSRLPMCMPALLMLLAALALATALPPPPTYAVPALASHHAGLPIPSSSAASNGAPVCAQFQTLGSLSVSGFMHTLDVSGTLAYVGMGDITAPSLGILDVGDPFTPTLRSNYSLPGYVRDIQIVGTLAYIADDTGLDIIDVSDPDQ